MGANTSLRLQVRWAANDFVWNSSRPVVLDIPSGTSRCPFHLQSETNLSVKKEICPCLVTVPLATAVFTTGQAVIQPPGCLATPGDGSGSHGEGEGAGECCCPPVGRGPTWLKRPTMPRTAPLSPEPSSPRLADFWVAQFSQKDVSAISFLISKAPVP